MRLAADVVIAGCSERTPNWPESPAEQGAYTALWSAAPMLVIGHSTDSAFVLSPREVQVLTCIAQGRTHHQVARILGISPNTVDTYVKRAKGKLGLGTKADLTRAVMFGHMVSLDQAVSG